MARIVNVAAAQLGPIQRADSRADVVERLLWLLRDAHARGADLVVYPELALTTFFPRWYMTDQEEIDGWFGADARARHEAALRRSTRLSLGFVLGGELTPDDHHYNTSILVDRDGRVVHRYRKVHLPGHRDHEPWRPFQHLEKRYFEPGPEGFTVSRAFGGIVGMLICNDRRWPEAYRSLGLQGVELICIGYNTPVHNPPAPDHDRLGDFHNHLVMQSGAYQNGTWVVGVAKAGDERRADDRRELHRGADRRDHRAVHHARRRGRGRRVRPRRLQLPQAGVFAFERYAARALLASHPAEGRDPPPD
jgi:predicted amidohydrolase